MVEVTCGAAGMKRVIETETWRRVRDKWEGLIKTISSSKGSPNGQERGTQEKKI